MSESAIKRQKLCKEMRRKEVENFMKRTREKLTCHYLSQNNDLGPKPVMSEQILQHLKEQLNSTNYSSQGCVNFLRQVNSFSIQSLANPFLFKYIRYILMNVFDQESQRKQHQKQIHQLSKDICFKIIEYPPINERQLLIDNCYNQILNIASNDKFDMWQLWPVLGLIRSQAFFYQSFRDFMICMIGYQQQIDGILTLILQTFLSFTSDIQGYTKVKLSIHEISQIIGKINIILDKLDLGDSDLLLTVQTLQNIFKINPFSAALTLVQDTLIIPYLLQYIDQWKEHNLKTDTLRQILAFLGLILSGPSEFTQSLLIKFPNFIAALKNILPISPIFNQIQIPSSEWLHTNNSLILGSLFCFSNISASDNTTYLLFNQKIFKTIFFLSSYPSYPIKSEIAIFCYNSVLKANEQQLEIICEENLILALNNLIREQYSTESMLYGLRALMEVLKRTDNFPRQNLAWHFNNDRVISECRRYQLPQFIDGLITYKVEQVAKAAQKCTNMMPKDPEYI